MGVAIPDPRLLRPELLIPGRKPLRGVKVDRAHWAGAVLVEGWLFNDGDGDGLLFDLNMDTHGAPALVLDDNPYVDLDGSADSFKLLTGFDAASVVPEGTMHVRVRTDWDDTSASTQDTYLWTFGAGGGFTHGLRWQGGGGHRWIMYLNGGGAVVYDPAQDHTDFFWLTVSWGAAGLYVYVDGALVYSNAANSVMTSATDGLTFGASFHTVSTPYPMDGALESAWLFNQQFDADQVRSLTEDPCQLLTAIGKPLLFTTGGTPGITLVIDPIDQAQTLDEPSLNQANNLQPQSLSQLQTTDEPALIQAGNLVVHNLGQSQVVEALSLSVSTDLSIAGITQEQSLEQVDLTQAHVVGVHEITQTQATESLSLEVAGMLTVAGAVQAQVMGQPDLVQAHTLALQELLQGQLLDEPALDIGASLSPESLHQAQSTATVALVQAHLLAVDQLAQTQLLVQLDLTQAHLLVIQSLQQAQSLESPALDVSIVLSVSDAAQAQIMDAPDLVQANVLTLFDALQAQTLDTPGLLTASTLVVSDLVHQQLLDNIDLFTGVLFDEITHAITVRAERRTVVVIPERRIIRVH